MSSSEIDSDDDSLLTGYNDIGGLTYGVGILCIGVILIVTVSFATYMCILSLQRSNRNRRAPVPDPTRQLFEAAAVAGLDEATIESYPKLTFSEARKMKSSKGEADFCCSICLADYSPSDVLRSLPECGHLFHRKCVDPWLRLHPTCPVCRSSPMPTPLAEVVPLAMATSRSEIPI